MAPGRDALGARAALLDRVAAEGLDLDAARARVESLRSTRRRVRRGAVLGCAATLLAVGLAWGLQDRTDPDEVVADRGDTTSSTTTTAAAPTTAQIAAPTVDVTLAPITTAAPAAPTTTAAPAPTVPVAPAPNQAMRVELRGPATVAAGDTVTLEVAWIDADHTGVAPEISVDWADPAVATLGPTGVQPRCDTPGPGAGGTERRSFRYATPGPKVVRVTVRTCGGQGSYAEAVTTTSTLEVTEPRLGDEPARVVVAVSPRTPDGAAPTARLDDGLATVRAADPLVAAVVRPPRTPPLEQFATPGPATVLVLPVAAQGQLQLSWTDVSCVSEAEVLPAPAGSVTQVVLAPGC